MNKKLTTGFTLIEMMIVVAIIGIIAAIAFPSYNDQVRKGKRTDAKVELLKISQLQESFFAQNLSYANDLDVGVGGLGLGTIVESEQQVYLITMTAQDATNGTCNGTSADSCSSYVLTATPQNSQINDTCGAFTLTGTGVRNITGTSETTQRCWR